MPADARLEDLPSLALYAARVAARLERPRRLAVEDEIAATAAAHAWFLARVESSQRAIDDVVSMSQPKTFPARWEVQSAQMHCQKPFHLWNVTRDEWKSGIAFERGLRYVLGRAAHEGGPTKDGRPGTVEPATRVAEAGDRERAETHAGAWGSRQTMWKLLAQDPARSGLGKREASVPLESEPPLEKKQPGSGAIGGAPTTWTAPPGFGQ